MKPSEVADMFAMTGRVEWDYFMWGVIVGMFIAIIVDWILL